MDVQGCATPTMSSADNRCVLIPVASVIALQKKSWNPGMVIFVCLMFSSVLFGSCRHADG